jgi:hypothetical protein
LYTLRPSRGPSSGADAHTVRRGWDTWKCYLLMKPSRVLQTHWPRSRGGEGPRGRGFPYSDAALRSQSYRFSTSHRRLARSQNQVSFPKPASPTKDGARSRRLDRPAHQLQTTLRSRRENPLRQGSYSFTYPARTTAPCSPLSPDLSSVFYLRQGRS